MTDLEHDLAAAADGVQLTHGDLDVVIARGRQRRQRRQRVLSGVTAIAVVASVAAVMNLRRDSGTPLATVPPMNQGNAGLEWEVQSTSSGLGMSGPGANGSGPYYALSTAAGQADVNKARPSRVVWRSDDGVEWTAASTLGKDLYLSDLSPNDGRVYAVGTAPGQAGVKRRGDLVAGWSDDGGKSFSKRALPVDWNAIESVATSVSVLDTQVASTNKGTVATAVVQAALDVPRLLPNGVTAPDGWATTASGVDVLGPEKDATPCPDGYTTDKAVLETGGDSGRAAKIADANGRERDLPRQREVEPGWCFAEDGSDSGVSVTPQEMRGVVRSVTWDELGVIGDARLAASKHLFGFFADVDSTDFERVDLGDARTDVGYLDADDAGFNLFASGVTYGSSPAGSVDMHSTDGKTWTSVAGPSGLNWISAAGTVNGVRTVIGDSETGSVIARVDGSGGWSVKPLSNVIENDGRPVHTLAAGIGGLGVIVALYPEAERTDRADAMPPTLLAYSRDGVTWENHPVEELAGHKVGVPLRVIVSGARAVVALSGGSSEDGKATKPQTILVATPA
ncbi:MAG: hypothetical protein QOI61_1675 [Actinomycetota bacterium]